MSNWDRERKNRRRNNWGGGTFTALPRRFVQSQTLAGLSTAGCKLFLDLLASYNGFNNGDLAITWLQMKRRGWRSKATLKKATDELLARGIIIRTRHGGRRSCHLYAVTLYVIDECGGKLEIPATKAPLNSWLRDEPLRPLHELQAEFRQKQSASNRPPVHG